MENILDKFKDEQEFRDRLDEMFYVWSHNGVGYDAKEKKPLLNVRYRMKDTLALPNATFLIPQVINQFLREGIEPMLVGPSLLARIDYRPGMTVSFPAIGALTAYDVAPGQEFAEYGPDMGGAEMTEIKVTKSGLALKFLDDLVEQDNFGLVRLWVRLAANALARHKETKIFNFISAAGVTIYNNDASPSTYQTPVKGFTTGRDLTGAFNGTLTHDDFFEAVAFGMSQGYFYNTILMHPLTWAMWVKDQYLRAFALQNGGGPFFGTWNGNPAVQANNWNDPIQKLGPTPPGQNVGPATVMSEVMSQLQNTAPTMPGYFPFPMRIIVSPFVRFDDTNKVTDIIMFDASNLGAMIVKEDIRTNEWKEPSRDITKMKIWESYALAILNSGQGIGVIRNVKIDSNQLVLPAQSTFSVANTPSSWVGLSI